MHTNENDYQKRFIEAKKNWQTATDKELNDKPFDKNKWLKQLAEDIQSDSETLETTEGEELESITLENLEGILKRYFPKFKLILYDRTPTNTGDNTPELASTITTPIRQSQDEDDTGADTTSMQVVSSERGSIQGL